MFNLYCLIILLSQFSGNFKIGLGGFGIGIENLFAILLIIVDILSNKGKIRHNTSIKKNEWLKMMFYWVLYGFIAIIWAKDKMSSIQVLIILFEGLIYIYYGKKLVDSKDKYLKILKILSIALFVHIIICILELKFGLYFFTSYSDKYLLKGYPASMFLNTNNLSTYLSVMIFFLLILFNSVKKIGQKVFYLILILVSFIINLKTSSRASIIACIFGFLIFFLLAIKNKKISFYFLIGIICLTSIYVFNSNVNTYVDNIINETFTINMNASYGSDVYRKNSYLNGLDFYKKTLGFGVGIGNVEYWMENYGTRNTNFIKPLHCWWLEILVTSGTIIFFYMIKTWIEYYKKLIKKYFSKQSNKSLFFQTCSTISLGIVYCISSFSPSSLYKQEWIWALLCIFFLSNDCLLKNEKDNM